MAAMKDGSQACGSYHQQGESSRRNLTNISSCPLKEGKEGEREPDDDQLLTESQRGTTSRAKELTILLAIDFKK